jgi:hypothetical protein
MAQCKSCGAKVGCGCQLINGLCSYCNGKLKQGVNKFKHVITKTYELYRMF